MIYMVHRVTEISAVLCHFGLGKLTLHMLYGTMAKYSHALLFTVIE